MTFWTNAVVVKKGIPLHSLNYPFWGVWLVGLHPKMNEKCCLSIKFGLSTEMPKWKLQAPI
ncbi:hypothetical protein CLV58_12731 [Spirosoma oryzae]|uniref:Uncharacterized protein n=1 Tax=Spirosoma oryzae TaxID=1469603 RepID=A0A2T0S6Q8_9BACT|nr:hypothetical protein CLV58_12731 [Spirosoma oryzae]